MKDITSLTSSHLLRLERLRMTALSDYVVFNDAKLARRYANRRIPMTTLYEAYFRGDVAS